MIALAIRNIPFQNFSILRSEYRKLSIFRFFSLDIDKKENRILKRVLVMLRCLGLIWITAEVIAATKRAIVRADSGITDLHTDKVE